MSLAVTLRFFSIEMRGELKEVDAENAIAGAERARKWTIVEVNV